jgi:hypothetical protein
LALPLDFQPVFPPDLSPVLAFGMVLLMRGRLRRFVRDAQPETFPKRACFRNTLYANFVCILFNFVEKSSMGSSASGRLTR